MIEEALVYDKKNPLLHYDLACYQAQRQNRDSTLEALSLVLELAPSFREFIGKEAEFDIFRNDPKFISLLEMITP